MFSFVVYSQGLFSMKHDLCGFIHSFFALFLYSGGKKENFYTALNILKNIFPQFFQSSTTPALFLIYNRVAFFVYFLSKHQRYKNFLQKSYNKLIKSFVYNLAIVVSHISSYNIQQSSLVVQLIRNLPAMQETLVQFLGQENPLEKG